MCCLLLFPLLNQGEIQYQLRFPQLGEGRPVFWGCQEEQTGRGQAARRQKVPFKTV